MSRPKKCRRVCREPSVESFSPNGVSAVGIVVLSVDEYEAVRLIDYENMTHEECAVQMKVARATISDMYNKARFKIADAMVNGKTLLIDGGHYQVCRRAGRCAGYGRCRMENPEESEE